MAQNDLPRGIGLILGGTRSGKSRFAENLIIGAGGGVYIATGRAWDDEMADRIAHHRNNRGPLWDTVEEPLDLCGVLQSAGAQNRPVLVDCLTLWLTNLMLDDRDIASECRALCDLLPELPMPVLLVSNEVGMGIVPENAMARAFRDHAGRLHQNIAALADHVTLIVAGIAVPVKPAP